MYQSVNVEHCLTHSKHLITVRYDYYSPLISCATWGSYVLLAMAASLLKMNLIIPYPSWRAGITSSPETRGFPAAPQWCIGIVGIERILKLYNFAPPDSVEWSTSLSSLCGILPNLRILETFSDMSEKMEPSQLKRESTKYVPCLLPSPVYWKIDLMGRCNDSFLSPLLWSRSLIWSMCIFSGQESDSET